MADQESPVKPDLVPGATRSPAGRYRSELRTALLLVLAIVAAGIPLGALWRAVAPRVELINTAVGFYPVEEEPEGFVGADGWFALIWFVTGLLLAVLAWVLLRRHRGPVVLAALAASSIGGAAVSAWIGHRIGLDGYEQRLADAEIGQVVLRQVEIRTDLVVLSGAVAAVGLYTMLAAFHLSPSLQPDDPADLDEPAARPEPVGSGPEDGAEPAQPESD